MLSRSDCASVGKRIELSGARGTDGGGEAFGARCTDGGGAASASRLASNLHGMALHTMIGLYYSSKYVHHKCLIPINPDTPCTAMGTANNGTGGVAQLCNALCSRETFPG